MMRKHTEALNESQVGLLENSKATVHNVPPLALPMSDLQGDDTATQFLQVSRMPSSHRNNFNQLSHSASSFAKIKSLQ